MSLGSMTVDTGETLLKEVVNVSKDEGDQPDSDHTEHQDGRIGHRGKLSPTSSPTISCALSTYTLGGSNTVQSPGCWIITGAVVATQPIASYQRTVFRTAARWFSGYSRSLVGRSACPSVRRGTARLVGTSKARIVSEASTLLCDPLAYERMTAAPNPYGDGHAFLRIQCVLEGLDIARTSAARAATDAFSVGQRLRE
jgi:hypothetical protein